MPFKLFSKIPEIPIPFYTSRCKKNEEKMKRRTQKYEEQIAREQRESEAARQEELKDIRKMYPRVQQLRDTGFADCIIKYQYCLYPDTTFTSKGHLAGHVRNIEYFASICNMKTSDFKLILNEDSDSSMLAIARLIYQEIESHRAEADEAWANLQ